MNVSDVTYAYKRYAVHERGMRPMSYRSIMASVAMLSDWADTDDIRRLDHGTAQAFLYWGREERAWEARTFRNHRQYLKSFFAWCVKQQYIKRNPIDGIEKPKLPHRLPRCLSREDTQKILSQVRWYPWQYEFAAVRNETILNLLIFTGLRLQEMLDLEVTDVNLDSAEIFVRQGKGGKDRMVPIHPRLRPVLTNYLAAKKARSIHSQFFITGAKSGKPMCGKHVRTVCQKLSRASGCYFTPHMLRHTFGRLTVESGWDIFKIKEVMGHSEITTTQGYLSVSTENIKSTFGDLTLL
jgi:site-specific recombinase XerD